MKAPVRFSVGLLAVAALVGCGETAGPTGDADLRVLHATPALGPIAVEVAGVTVLAAVPYGMTSGVVRVPAGRQRIVVRSGSQILGELEPTLTAQHVNSVVVAEGLPQFMTLVTPDTGQTASNRANVRMVNVIGTSQQPPTLLDVKVKAPNANPDSVITLGIDTQIARYGSLMYFDPGHFNFKYLPACGTTVLAEVSFDVAAGEKKAVVLQRAANGGYSVQVMLEP